MNEIVIDKPIVDFIVSHHVLTLATVSDCGVWCSNMFYALDRGAMRLVFSSAEGTRHIAEGLAEPNVACSIVVESRVIGRLRGAQIEGTLSEVSIEDQQQCKALYLKRFPYAALRLEKLWVIEIRTIKFTDNTLGFGKKLYFDRYAHTDI